jgi:hypothetical protein
MMGTITTLVSTDDCSAEGTSVSARVIKRVAEGSLGLPKEVPYWFVVPRDPRAGLKLFEYRTCAEAKAVHEALEHPEDYLVLGPVVRPAAPLKSLQEEVCKGTPVVVTPLRTITLTFDDPNTEQVVLCAKEWDALFWGDSSVDKFAIPYYVTASDIEYGLKVYNEFHGTDVGCIAEEARSDDPPAYALVHEPDTDYTVYKLPGTHFIAQPEEIPR